MSQRFGSLLVLLLPLSIACSPEADGEEAETSASAASITTKEEVGVDAQVLQIWTPGRVFPTASHGWLGSAPSDVSLDASNPRECPTLRAWTTASTKDFESREVDCAAALGAAAPFDVDGSPGPVMTPVRFVVTTRRDDGFVTADPDFCSRVEVRVVVRDASLAERSFAGIGFWSSRGDSFTPRASLQLVGHARLATGDEASVFRFTGISTCISSAHHSTSGNLYQTFAFKPYAAYDRAGTRYRVWENIAGNHLIGKSWPGAQPSVDTVAFDRQRDLLAR
jgi:hypothetical protein